MGSDPDLEVTALRQLTPKYLYITYNFMNFLVFLKGETTVDGRNPAPVDMVKNPIIYRVLAPSQLMQDFFHQQ